MFGFIKNTLLKIYSQVTSQLGALFGRSVIDEDALKELEILLISSDTGVQATRSIMEQLRMQVKNGSISRGADLRTALERLLSGILEKVALKKTVGSSIYFLVGINGSGKTTFAGKLAALHAKQGKRVLLVAADTFRAAAPEQLTSWAERTGVDIVLGEEGQDPASVVFRGCDEFIRDYYDILIIDTAGRLQAKKHLMAELQKMKGVVTKKLPQHTTSTILTIDAMLGQNSFEQARLFKDSTDVNGIALTKMDGTGKGGIVFSITQQLDIPICYISFGEQLEQYREFDVAEYVHNLLYK